MAALWRAFRGTDRRVLGPIPDGQAPLARPSASRTAADPEPPATDGRFRRLGKAIMLAIVPVKALLALSASERYHC